MTDQDSNSTGPSIRPSSRLRRPGAAAVAPALSLVGLVVAGLLTVAAYTHFTPQIGEEATPTPTPTAVASGAPSTAAPTQTILVNPEVSVPGQLVYARSGNLWIQSGTTARQLTQSASGWPASQPAFSPDGQWVYFIETRTQAGRWYAYNGNLTIFTLNFPVLCRIHPDGTGQVDVLSSLFHQGSLTTFFFMREPSVHPNGNVIAVASDGPKTPGVQDVLIHYITVSTRKMGGALNLPENAPLGLSEPAFSPDGKALAYTQEQRNGKLGTPSIWVFRGGAAHRLAGGYRAPSWSPDGKYIAATQVNGDRLDVVVLDASTGKQVGQVTSDGASWGPVWSPDGKTLVYTHMTGPTVDLNMVYIGDSGSNLTFKIEPRLTDFTGLDGGSRPAWYVPGYGPTPQASPGASSSDVPMPSDSAPASSSGGDESAAPSATAAAS
jgi:dipeptidyl aminopeptidase/acylaminoacyl peptidase